MTKLFISHSSQDDAFVRGLRVDLGCGTTHLLLSGTASIGTDGEMSLVCQT